MFAHHQPAAVCKEEATQGVVRVGVSLRVLVMQPVITRPLYNVVLSPTN